MNKTKFVKWLKATVVRALKTIAETAIATIGTSAAMSKVDWKFVLSASLLSGILCVLTCIKGLPEVPDEEAVDTAGE